MQTEIRGDLGVSKEFKARPDQLVPEVLAITLAGILTYVLRASSAPVEPITFFPETAGGATLNAGIFVIFMAFAGAMMYVFVKFGFKRIVRYLINFAMLFLLLFLFTWYGALYTDYLPKALVANHAWTIISLLATAILALAIFKSKGILHLGSIVIIGGLTGTFLGVSIPILTATALLLALAAYDLFAVYRGPIGKIAQKADLEEFTGAVFTYGDLTVGMGDMVFYSMLASNAMMNYGPVPFLGAAAGLIVGAFLGFKMLEGREMFPGLPFAILLGLGFMFAAYELATILP